MTSVSTIAAIRFGYGLGPNLAPLTKASLLEGLSASDAMAKKYPVTSTDKVLVKIRAFRAAKKAANASDGRQDDMAERIALRNSAGLGLLHATTRILDTDTAIFERLTWFWADHFTAVGKNLNGRAVAPAYIDEAIRPHVTARFADMLKAAITHPLMLEYLDQTVSVGPNSKIGKRREKGLNENLARELLELHTLGVGGGYVQGDVRQLAELLTGLRISPDVGFVFDARMSEPGTKTILGKTYGRGVPDLDAIYDALDDLARHPDTARHIARKLAVHFVSDTPDVGLVDQLAAAYATSDGDLMVVYQALLEHPAAWEQFGQKVKKPFDFIMSALVAFGISGKQLIALKDKQKRNLVARPMVAMGQPFMEARGPDGWPEAAEEWITPQGLASRIAWSVDVSANAAILVRDSRKFLQTTLADAAGEPLRQAVAQTETIADGLTLVLASAEFNRQ